MAFLVSYLQDGVPDWREKVIYLDQEFYVALGECRAALHPGGVLSVMVGLKYGDVLVLARPRLSELFDEMDRIDGARLQAHRQFDEFGAVVRSALGSDLAIAVSGDMLPELD